MHKLPRLFKSCHGVFYLRLARGGQEVQRSLRTEDSELEMTLDRFDMVLRIRF